MFQRSNRNADGKYDDETSERRHVSRSEFVRILREIFVSQSVEFRVNVFLPGEICVTTYAVSKVVLHVYVHNTCSVKIAVDSARADRYKSSVIDNPHEFVKSRCAYSLQDELIAYLNRANSHSRAFDKRSRHDDRSIDSRKEPRNAF